MSISIQESWPRTVAFGDVAVERNRCALIVEGLPLGYRTDAEHEVLENFARKVIQLIRAGVAVENSID